MVAHHADVLVIRIVQAFCANMCLVRFVVVTPSILIEALRCVWKFRRRLGVMHVVLWDAMHLVKTVSVHVQAVSCLLSQ